jgi:hypothetical protein
MSEALYDTERYKVIKTEPGTVILAEDGKYHEWIGYAVINKETEVVEHTTMMLPGAIFQCQHFNDTLTSLMTPVEPAEVFDLQSIEVDGDVVPN